MDETRRDKAARLFGDGCNCAQAVLCAYADVLGLDEELAAKLAFPFGGGMGRLREVCGAVSAMLMVLGLTEGCDLAAAATPAMLDGYARVRALAGSDREAHGSILCRELLERIQQDPPQVPLKADGQPQRPCIVYVLGAVDLIEREISPRA